MASYHNVPVPGTVMVPVQMAPNVPPAQNTGSGGSRAAPGGQSSIGMGSSYQNFRG